jgi:hypothetical protein
MLRKLLTASELKTLCADLESEVDNLELFRLSLENALIWSLRAYDDGCRAPLLISLRDGVLPTSEKLRSQHLHARGGLDALSELIPRIYKKCPKAKKFNVQFDDKKYEYGITAIDRADILHSILSEFFIVRTGAYFLKKDILNNNLVFSPKSRQSINIDARAVTTTIRTVDDEAEEFLSNVRISSARELPSVRAFYNVIKIEKDETINYDFLATSISSLVNLKNDFNKINWHLDKLVNLGPYTVANAKEIWSSLVALCFFHNKACLECGLVGVGIQYLPIIIKLPNLIEVLHSICLIDRSIIKKFLIDLTYDPDEDWDVIYQPILPFPDRNIVALSPYMFMFSRGPRNLMKLWSRKYPGIYGAKIAKIGETQEKVLADLFRLSNSQFSVVHSKKICDDSGQTVGDLDVGIYDEISNSLLLIELKWFQNPDSPQEVQSSDEKLNVGVRQVEKVKKYFEFNPSRIDETFNIQSKSSLKIFVCVVSNSNIGSFWVKSGSIQIFHWNFIVKIINLHQNSNIQFLFKLFNKAHNFRSQIDYRHVLQVSIWNNHQYFSPATMVLDYPKNSYKKTIRWIRYFLFSVILRDSTLFWQRIYVKPFIFQNSDKSS